MDKLLSQCADCSIACYVPTSDYCKRICPGCEYPGTFVMNEKYAKHFKCDVLNVSGLTSF